MNKDEALRLAWDALEDIGDEWGFTSQRTVPKRKEAITAIKEALAQTEQEPFEYWNAVEGWVKIDEVREHFDSVGCGTIYKTAGEGREPLYTTPPQRKPLTDEEIEKCYETTGHYQTLRPQDRFAVFALARAIEAAHGIKGEE